MKRILTILLSFLAIQSFTQEWAPTGAIWHYTQYTINPEEISYTTYESVSDTMINGVMCKKIIEENRAFGFTTYYHYMYEANDSVFFFKEGDFHLLYDFGANAGDSIGLDYFPTVWGDSLIMIIDSVSTIDINGVLRKIQYVSCGDGIMLEFGGEVIEGIGNTNRMFPTYDGGFFGPLRCYEDDVLGLFLNPFHPNYGWNFEDCNQIITGVKELETANRIKIFPNPAHSEVMISGMNETAINEVNIYNITGQCVLHIPGSDRSVDVSKLPEGMYVIEVLVGEKRFTQKIMKL